MIARRGRALGGALGRALGPILDAFDGLGAPGPGTLVVGAEDPGLPGADAERRLVVMPAIGPRRPSPWAAELVLAADAVVLLHPDEARQLAGALDGRGVLLAGLPAIPDAPEGRGLDPGGSAHPALVERWHLEAPPVLQPPGIAWVGGLGATAIAEALAAWAARRAVVVLPGTPPHDLLHGAVLRAETELEVLEASAFLTRNAPFARALASRGRALAAHAPSPTEVALVLLEAVEVARLSLAARP